MKTPILLACLLALGHPVLSFGQKMPPHYDWDHLPVIRQTDFKKDTFNIVRFGAVPDGVTLNTNSINKAIATCSAQGGGVVLVPGGLWMTGPIVLKSNVNLHLERSAIIQFTRDFDQYPLIAGSFEGKATVRNQPPVSGTDLTNVAITGRGVIDGNGDSWRMITRDRMTESEWKAKLASGGIVSSDGRTWYPSEKTRLGQEWQRTGRLDSLKTHAAFDSIKDYLRPNLVVLANCRKVLLEGGTFENSPAWCLHPLMCEDVTVRNISVKNPSNAQNGDGIDVESCRNVLIEESTFECGDDGICIKSGRNEEGRKRGRPTENVIVRNNIVYHAHGGFVIGSEMSGGARNIFVSDCSFIGTDKGLRFKTARGRGGVVEDIYVRNIYMKNIVGEAIYFDMYYFTKPPAPGQKLSTPPVTEATPRFRHFELRNIVACLK
jgi:polygalacturonase